MRPRLLLALALLGSACAHRPGPPQPPQVPAAERGHRFRYAVVTKCYSYERAQRHCREVLRGQLASVHSAARNEELLRLARTYTRRSLWIGAVTARRGWRWESKWEDASPWNFANWAPTHPSRLFTTCATLSTLDGLWRSSFCFQKHPFICQY